MSSTIQEVIQLKTKTKNFPIIIGHSIILVEIDPGKTLNINPNLSPSPTEELLKIIHNDKDAFSWEFTLIYVTVIYI